MSISEERTIEFLWPRKGNETNQLQIYFITRRALRRWLLARLEPCSQMAPLMSESLDRRLSLLESLNLRLHLMVCAWCALYLKQIVVIRTLAGKRAVAGNAQLSTQARERIALALKQDNPPFSPLKD